MFRVEVFCCVSAIGVCLAAQQPDSIAPVVRVVDMNVDETAQVRLSNGQTATVQLMALGERIDPVCFAVRQASDQLWVVDRCLDRGGAYNYDKDTCAYD